MDIDLTTIKELAKLVVEHKLDLLQLGSLTIEKKKHESAKFESQATQTALNEDLEDMLFHSTSAPSLSLEQMASMTVTPLKKAKGK